MVLAITSLAAVLLIAMEHLRPGRSFPRVRGWWLRALLFNGIQVGTVWVAGSVWDSWMLDHRMWNADGFGRIGGAAVGYVVITFIYYWWHRWRHEVPLLWRAVHQLHHSPQRIEILTSFYKHPLEIVINGLISSAILYLLVGVGRDAASLAVLLTGLAELFYHWNVRTPHWLGYVIQRPESHCVHHQEGVHSKNYSDLPVWDMLFGTFDNPRAWNARCGFGVDKEARLAAMLTWRDVNAPRISGARSVSGDIEL